MRAQCRTNIKNLQDVNGNLNQLQLTENDTGLQQILDEGYDWTVVPFFAAVCLPGLAALAAKALNAEQTSYPMESEVQVMASMAAFITQMKESKGKEPVKADVIAFAKSGKPGCRDYLPTLTDFVRYYSGGVNGPVPQFLDNCAQDIGANTKLGGVCFDAIVRTELPGSHAAKLPFLRAALAVAEYAVCVLLGFAVASTGR